MNCIQCSILEAGMTADWLRYKIFSLDNWPKHKTYRRFALLAKLARACSVLTLNKQKQVTHVPGHIRVRPPRMWPITRSYVRVFDNYHDKQYPKTGICKALNIAPRHCSMAGRDGAKLHEKTDSFVVGTHLIKMRISFFREHDLYGERGKE